MKAILELRQDRSADLGARPTPLVTDLGATIVKTDILLESLLALLKQKPLNILYLAVWLLKGKAYFKQQVARRTSLDVRVLPYRDDFLDYLRRQRAQGRTIVLATSADTQIARKVADHLKIFDIVLASDGTTNLCGESKGKRLVSEFGEKGFDYAGNDSDDLAVWALARRAIVVNPTLKLGSLMTKVAQVDRVFEDRGTGMVEHLDPLRPLHWLKNLLVFVPLITAHRAGLALWDAGILAFVAFGCFSSSGYLINDLLDLPADRHHPSKRFRAFAAGRLPLSYGLTMIAVLLCLGTLLGMVVSPLLVGVLLVYLTLALTYSLYLKQVVILDVIILAGLYTARLLAGSAAVGIWPSHWLLAFSTFLFFSLALVKRYGELVIMRSVEGDHAKARAYEIGDGELLSSMGIASGYLAVLVLALYINSDVAQELYGRCQLMWFLCPLLLYWISHLWLIAHRGKMPDDPVAFAIGDRTSRILILLMSATTVLAL